MIHKEEKITNIFHKFLAKEAAILDFLGKTQYHNYHLKGVGPGRPRIPQDLVSGRSDYSRTPHDSPGHPKIP